MLKPNTHKTFLYAGSTISAACSECKSYMLARPSLVYTVHTGIMYSVFSRHSAIRLGRRPEVKESRRTGTAGGGKSKRLCFGGYMSYSSHIERESRRLRRSQPLRLILQRCCHISGTSIDHLYIQEHIQWMTGNSKNKFCQFNFHHYPV
jgi:hypothetical protein